MDVSRLTDDSDGNSSRPDGLSFEQWRSQFFADARAHGLLHNAEQLGEAALRLFWRQGTTPTVRGLLESAQGSRAS